jgi:hypothetical protein
MLGRQPLGAPGEAVVRMRDLLSRSCGDTVNGNHVNIVCRGTSSFVNHDWPGDPHLMLK